MSQWNKLKWDHNTIAPAMQITLRPHVDADGKKTVKGSHDLHAWHELDWHSDDAKNEGAAHLHDGVTDHIRLVPEVRRAKALIDGKIVDAVAVAMHAVWHDKDGNIIRQDSVAPLFNRTTA